MPKCITHNVQFTQYHEYEPGVSIRMDGSVMGTPVYVDVLPDSAELLMALRFPVVGEVRHEVGVGTTVEFDQGRATILGDSPCRLINAFESGITYQIPGTNLPAYITSFDLQAPVDQTPEFFTVAKDNGKVRVIPAK